MLVLEAGQLAADEPEPAPGPHLLRVAHAGPVELAGDRRPPVQHHRLAGVVGDVPPADVEVRLRQVEPPEEQRRPRVVGQLRDAAGERPAQLFGGVRVPGDVLPGGEDLLGAVAHTGERCA